MVLIAGIEDDPGVAEVLGRCFQGAGWEWRRLSGSPETLGALREFRPDVVTTGNRHPTLPGVRLFEAMKRDLELQRMPLVFVTAHPRERLWDDIRKSGLDPEVAGYVSKPFDPADLVAEIRRVLDGIGVSQGSRT